MSACLLVLGLAAALVLFLVASPDAKGPLGEQTASKQYLHDLAVYGGKANILQDQFRRWFASLWHGRSLAGTVAVLSLLTFAAIRFLAGPRRPAGAASPASARERGRLRLVGSDDAGAGRGPRPPGRRGADGRG